MWDSVVQQGLEIFFTFSLIVMNIFRNVDNLEDFFDPEGNLKLISFNLKVPFYKLGIGLARFLILITFYDIFVFRDFLVLVQDEYFWF